MKLKLAYTVEQLAFFEAEWLRLNHPNKIGFNELSGVKEFRDWYLFLAAIHEARLKEVLSEPL